MYRVKNYIFPELNGYLPNIDNTFLGKLTTEVHNKVQAPFPLVLLTAIQAASVGYQHRVKILLSHGKLSSISTYAINVAKSGERKTGVENLLMQSIREVDKKEREYFSECLRQFELEQEAFQIKRKLIKNKFSKNINFDFRVLAEELSTLDKLKPEKPKLKKRIYEDTTIAALLEGLAKNYNNGYLGSSEGGIVFQSGIMSAAPVLNGLYSGENQTVDRKTSESLYLDDARLTIHIMTQPSTLHKLQSKSTNDIQGNGFLARCLVSVSESLCGYRFSDNIKLNQARYLDEFNFKITDSLTKCESSGDTVLRLSDEAKDAIVQIANDIEAKQQPGGKYENDTDHASKLVENIQRIAAILHCLNSDVSGNVELEELLQATEIVSFFSDHYLSLFSDTHTVRIGAAKLYRWLKEKYIDRNIRYLRCNWVIKRGPVCVRNKKFLNNVLDLLEQDEYIRVFNHKNYNVIDLRPRYKYNDKHFWEDLAWQKR